MAKESGWVKWNARQAARKNDPWAGILGEKDKYAPPKWGGEVKGRAPAGEGAEYQARRWLNATQQTILKTIGDLEKILSDYRGQANQRNRITKARARIQALREAQAMANSVVGNSLATWKERQDAVKLIMSYAEYQYLD